MLNQNSGRDSRNPGEDQEKPIARKWIGIIFGGFFTLAVFGMLAVYWFMPFTPTQIFVKAPSNSNFNPNSSSLYNDMQFYSAMRYPSSNISYEINTTECNLQRQNDMEGALKRIENVTVLHFYSVTSNPEISVSCDNKVVMNKSYFIAGEGGVINVTQTKSFNVIEKGEVLLLKDSNCAQPNIATHELLHALGFKHSTNINNIMYPIHYCYQTIGQDIPALINQLYSYPSLPDLAIENASATIKGRYINANVTIGNWGLVDSNQSSLIISSDSSQIRVEEIPAIPIGSSITFSFTNLLAPVGINQIDFNVLANFSELKKNNNKIELVLKK